MKLFFEAAVERGTVATSAKVALLVGSILALINYGDRIPLHGDMRVLDWFKIAVTYCVPYCVATYGAARYATRHARNSGGNTTADSNLTYHGGARCAWLRTAAAVVIRTARIQGGVLR